jgi:hypothetical protein
MPQLLNNTNRDRTWSKSDIAMLIKLKRYNYSNKQLEIYLCRNKYSIELQLSKIKNISNLK